MSVHVMAMVWKSGMPKNQKMTLLAYADHANDDGTSVYPGEDVMAEKTSDSPGNVRRVTKQLIEDGVLIQTKRGHRGQRAEFRINLKQLAAHIARHSKAEIAAHPEPDSRAETADSRAPVSRKARATATPNHQEPSEPSGNHQLAAKPRNPTWDTLVELFGQPAPNRTALYGRVEKYLTGQDATPDEIRHRAARIVTDWGPEKLTLTSLESHWSRFDGAAGQITEQDVRRFQRGTVKATTYPDDHPASIAKRKRG